TRRVGAGS
ncbi:beta-hexosaminidase domain protein, partial [Vibrio parahaemolyticus VP2007-007]